MSKFDLKIKARKMRSEGMAIRAIAKELGIARSTASLWVRDIVLSIGQLQEIRKTWLRATEANRHKGAFMQKQRRLNLIKRMELYGDKKFKNISKKEFYTAGIALYWAEGSKKTRKLELCNSDPKLIVFMISWFETFFQINIDRYSARITINDIHKNREEIIKKYWSNLTKIPLSQFQKTNFTHTIPKKIYENNDNYFGVFDLVVLKPGELYYKMLGLIHGLAAVQLKR